MARRRQHSCPADSTSPGSKQAGRFAYEGLDRVLHEKARLGIMTSLLSQPHGLSFADLRALCALSDGNLHRHLIVLSEARFVRLVKAGAGRGSRTTCHVTARGRQAFLEYLVELERVLSDAAAARGVPAEGTVDLDWG